MWDFENFCFGYTKGCSLILNSFEGENSIIELNGCKRGCCYRVGRTKEGDQGLHCYDFKHCHDTSLKDIEFEFRTELRWN